MTAGVEVALRLQHPLALDLDFRVEENEMVALVGPSGGGKSTILRLINGLQKPLSGKIKVNGHPWFDSEKGIYLPARNRKVGMVFQSYALFPHLTALENVAEAIPLRPKNARLQTAADWLARVHLGGLGDRLPGQMSGGQRQRVAVARALAREPDVLLLDEPFSAVDQLTRSRLQRELVELRSILEIPIILVTHDIQEAARLADRIAVLYGGRILQSDTYNRLSRFPADTSVARLIGIRNIFKGEVQKSTKDDLHLHLKWGQHFLQINSSNKAKPGEAVSWCIQSDGIIVHRRNRPSRGEHENPVFGEILEVFQFGSITEFSVDVSDPDGYPLHCSVPTLVAERNQLVAGARIGVSLKSDMIHVMSPQ